MLTFSIIIAVVIICAYLLRRNFRRSFYVLWTGDEKPDWAMLYRRWYGDKKGEELFIRDYGVKKEVEGDGAAEVK